MGKKITPNTTATEPKRIIVAGGGLAGLSTSLGLAKLGYRISIIEVRKLWLQQGSAFGLAANGRKALAELFHDPSSMGRLLEKGIYVQEYDSYLMIWYILRDALLEEVRKCTLIDVHMGKTVDSIDDTSDSSCVKVGVKDVETGTVEVMTGHLLVAADGVYSNIRGLLGLEPAKHATKTKWRGTIPYVPRGSVLEPYLDKGIVPLATNASFMQAMAEGACHVNLFNFHPKIDRKMTFVLNCSDVDLPSGTHPREIFKRQIPNPEHQEIMEEIYRLGDDGELTYPLPTVVVKLPEDSSQGWGGKGRVLLVGNAAHAMRPASGLGGAMAFEDAVVLCRILKAATSSRLNSRKSSETLVQQFECSRFDRVKTIWDDQWERSEAAYKKDYGGVKQTAMSGDFATWVRKGV